MELARVRLHGLTQRELTAAAQVQVAETESLFTERNQEYSDSRRCVAGQCLRRLRVHQLAISLREVMRFS